MIHMDTRERSVDLCSIIGDTTLHHIRQDTCGIDILFGQYHSRILEFNILNYHRISHHTK